ncbi:proton pump-interactor 1-like [Salvia splendens]|uniref:proton pump-interactor 1-like n=1 Tax=Salvia splendens TaxID=180675 RepID=UPI001C261DEC|nr:proton pump-interactor 1-like [Salvia splendens]XP_042066685.1 proton pump-interactor 1-like [Salvia splendens]
MGMEVVDSKLALDALSETDVSAEVGKVDIKFGSHGAEEPAKGVEMNKVAESNFPKDVVDEWPEPTQIHSFYIVRYRAFEDQNLKAKLDMADKDLQKKNQARSQIFEKLKTKRAERAEVRTQIHSLSVENKQFRSVLDEKRKEMEPLQHALGKLRGSSGSRDNRGAGVCSSEAELNDVIKSLQYRIQHESIPLSEEKQILREIKLLEGTREKVIAYASERARIQDSLGQKEDIQDQVKSIGVDLDGVRKEKQVVFAKIKQLDEEKLDLEKDINALEEELTAVTEKRDKIFQSITEMRKKRDEGNSPFYNNRNLLAKAKVLASKKDIDAVKELSNTEVENFMTLWNGNKAFRTDYESRILQSLDSRQLSKDGRLRNFDEKPLVVVERPVPSEAEVVQTKVKEASRVEAAPLEKKVAGKAKSGKNHKEETKAESALEKTEQEAPPVEKPQKDSRQVAVDEKKLKELKRAEEIAKRNQAEERKKKLAEKAATKAAIKAQKEAEKKLKEREKRARKKIGGGGAAAAESEEGGEAAAEDAEAEEKVEVAVAQKSKERKEHSVRQRGRARGGDSLPKAILKRKKATNYWMWGAAAAVVVILLAVVGYSYLYLN